MILRTGNRRREGSSLSHGFTLIELILVLAMLAIVLSLAGPSLARFFRGRTLDSEARRFLALTRYGQSRAVSEGVPMMLWIDARQGTYGLQAETSYTDGDTNAVEFVLDRDLQIEVEPSVARAQATPWRQTAQVTSNRPAIRFTPDGFISLTSPERVLIRESDDSAVWIGQNRTRLNYEIQTNQPPSLRR